MQQDEYIFDSDKSAKLVNLSKANPNAFKLVIAKTINEHPDKFNSLQPNNNSDASDTTMNKESFVTRFQSSFRVELVNALFDCIDINNKGVISSAALLSFTRNKPTHPAKEMIYVMELKNNDDALDTEPISMEYHQINDDRIFCRFQLKDNKIGDILTSTLYANRKNEDYVMLCRFCGIDIGDGLTAKLDDKNPYYDAKRNIFTFLEDFMNWEQFAIVKHWIRSSDLNIIDISNNAEELKTLQKVCLFLGMDRLSQALYDRKDQLIVEIYNPQTPEEDVRHMYQWIQVHGHDSDCLWKRINSGWSACIPSYWRKKWKKDKKENELNVQYID